MYNMLFLHYRGSLTGLPSLVWIEQEALPCPVVRERCGGIKGYGSDRREMVKVLRC